jgi:galactokinase
VSQEAQRIGKVFLELYGGGALLVRSPGRVNLIGEHTDYNGGFVLPAAIDKAIYFACALHPGRRCRFHAADLGRDFEFELTPALGKSGQGWPDYLLGVIDQARLAGYVVPAMDCVFGGDIPVGAGLSSSAALAAGFAFTLNELAGWGVPPLETARLAQRAENAFVGVQCGIMDQFANLFGLAGAVIRLDCRSLDFDYVPFDRPDLAVVLCDTGVRRALAGSEYNVRRRQCEEGVRALRDLTLPVESLRDVTPGMLEAHHAALDPVVHRRCRYVVEENARVLEACQALGRGDFAAFGERMWASHRGLRDDYEVSCPELDALVGIAAEIPGVLGGRMMGAGFGGCTIQIVEAGAVEEFSARAAEAYRGRTGREATIHVTRIEAGTSVVPGSH